MGVLDGKVAIVTGAGRLRGIGRATAVALAATGAEVVVTGTGRDPATFPADEQAVNWHDVHSTVEQVEAQGRRGLALIGDVSQHVDVTRMVQQTLDTFGRLVLTHCGVYYRPVHQHRRWDGDVVMVMWHG